MGKNIIERAVSPYNAANRAIQHETYGLFAPAANINKPGMAGFDPRYFAVREQIVELSQAFLETIQPIIREVPEYGIDDILEPNCLYINVSARVVDTVSADGELEFINVTGSLMVFGTETAQTQVLFAEGRIWIREITLIDSEVVVDTFMPIGYDETINERFIEIENAVAENTADIEGLKTADTNIQGSISELRNAVDYTFQRLIETVEDVAELKTDVARVTNKANEVAEEVEGLSQTVTDLTARVNQIAGKQFEVKIVNGIDEVTEEGYLYMIPVSGDNQSDVDHYVEYLFTNGKPEYIGTTQMDLTEYLKKSEVTPLYEHNILLQFRSANASIQSAESDGTFVATLTLINQDPLEYTFIHNQDTSQTGPKVMELPEAWQLLRLYRAIQLSTDKNLNLSRPCSGALIKVDTTSAYDLLYCINNSISTKYYDFSDTEWKRILVVHASRIGVTSYVGNYTTEISVGHPTFSNDKETSLWKTRDEFKAGEYNKTDSFGNTYGTYYCQQRIYCQDTVRKLQ